MNCPYAIKVHYESTSLRLYVSAQAQSSITHGGGSGGGGGGVM